MRKISLVLIISVLGLTLEAQVNLPRIPGEFTGYQNRLQEIRQKGIHEKTDWKYKIAGGTVTSASYKELLTKYDNTGRIKEIIYLDKSGLTETISVYRYNPVNLPLVETIYYPDGTVVGRTKYTYNSENCIVDITETDQYDYIISKRVFVTDPDAKTVTELYYVEKDSILEKIIHFYNDLTNGEIIKEEYYEGPTQKKYTVKIIRDDHKILREEFQSEKNNVYYILIYTYDANGNNILIEKELPGGNKVNYSMNRFDTAGNKTGYTHFKDSGGIAVYYKYTYQ
jgi:hypothetical protein